MGAGRLSSKSSFPIIPPVHGPQHQIRIFGNYSCRECNHCNPVEMHSIIQIKGRPDGAREVILEI